MSNKGILVIGDVMLDKYWHGTSNNLAEEAPVASVSVSSSDYRAGGGANVAINIKKLARADSKVTLCAYIGNDEDGNILQDIICQAGIEASWIASNDYPTITKHRILCNDHQLVRVDFEKYLPAIELTTNLKQLIDSHSVIVLSDYNKGSLSKVQEIIKYASMHAKIVLVDPKGKNFDKYQGATLLTPNYKEYTEVVGTDDLDNRAYNLIDKLGLSYLLVTLGEQGMKLYKSDHSFYHACSYAEQVYDVTGAGDTVISSLAVSLSENKNIDQAIEYASHAAAIVVSQVGTSTATRQAVKNLMTEYSREQKGRQELESGLILDAKNQHDFDCAISRFENCQVLYWDYVQDNILKSSNISKIMSIKDSSRYKKLCIVIFNNFNHNLNNSLKMTHSIVDLSYCLGQISGVSKVIYSSSLDIKELVNNAAHKDKSKQTVVL